MQVKRKITEKICLHWVGTSTEPYECWIIPLYMDSKHECLEIQGGGHSNPYCLKLAKAATRFSEGDLGLVHQLLKGNPRIETASPIKHQKQVHNKKLIPSNI